MVYTKKKINIIRQRFGDISVMALSKKDLGKKNKAKVAKAEVLSKQAAGGSAAAKKKLKKLNKKIR